jgi:hypothetical protein
MKKRASKLRQSVAENSRKQKAQSSQYGYLNLPQGATLFKEEPDSKVMMDFLMYEITDKHHPDLSENLVVGDLWYRKPFKVHRNIGVDNEAVVCPTSIGKPCPICEYRSKRIKEGAPKEEVDPLKASQRDLYVVVPIDNKKYEAKPHIWDISQFNFQKMLNDEIGEDEDRAVFSDMEEGLTLKIRFGSKTIGSSKAFAETTRIDFLERDKKYDEKTLKEIPNLDEVLNIMDYKQLELKFMEISDDDTEDEDVKEEKPKGKFASKEADDEEDEEEATRDKKGKGEKSRRTVSSGADKESSIGCPSGHVFGVDCEKHDDCDSCDEWDKCYDSKKKKERK